ncbi:hypothetical protein T09_14585 [Trichinella sp. T9]|nr:hypothetical protein T09_14585 [Trichinella sp. T9]
MKDKDLDDTASNNGVQYLQGICMFLLHVKAQNTGVRAYEQRRDEVLPSVTHGLP